MEERGPKETQEKRGLCLFFRKDLQDSPCGHQRFHPDHQKNQGRDAEDTYCHPETWKHAHKSKRRRSRENFELSHLEEIGDSVCPGDKTFTVVYSSTYSACHFLQNRRGRRISKRLKQHPSTSSKQLRSPMYSKTARKPYFACSKHGQRLR